MPLEETLHSLKTTLSESNLSVEDRDDLYSVLSQMTEDECKAVAALFKAKPDWVYTMMDNLTLKRSALSFGDHGRWKAIVEEEEQQLRELF
jgi:hypothetical protein